MGACRWSWKLAVLQATFRLMQEVGQEVVAGLGEHTLRVELNPLQMVVIAVAKPHHGAVFQFGGHLKAFRQAAAFRNQTVVSRGREWLRQACEYPFSSVLHRGCLAMHQFRGTNDPTAVGLSQGLMPQAHPQCWDLWRQLSEYIQADACLIGISRPRRQKNGVGLERADFLNGESVVPFHP